jgi:hypothetical protein
MIVVVGARFSGWRWCSLRNAALDIFDLLFRQQVAEPAASIPNSLRRFPRIIDGHVRAIGKF